jgi:signal transduction histidine kinase
VPAAARRLVELSRELARGLDAAAQQITQIEHILADQERFSRAERVVEPVALPDLLNDALQSVPDELQRTMTLVITPEVASIGSISVPRTALLQVFGNLLTNASESIRRAGRLSGTVRVGAIREMAGDRPVLHLSVCDDGAGIASGDLERLFERGFTTKGHGHGGLGLHWCANVVASMQGRLYAESAGPGQGACFHLILPFGKGSGEKP